MGTPDNNQLIKKLESTKLLGKTMGGYFDRLREASTSAPKKKVAWCTSVGPAELLWSMGFEVYFPENHAAMIGSSKMADKYISKAQAAGYSPEICSYLTSDIGAYLSKETPLSKFNFKALPKPDVLVYNTNQCHEVQDWLSFYANEYKVPLLGICTPFSVGEISEDMVQHLAKQFENLVPKLQKISGNKFDLERLKSCVALSREACVLWRQVLETAMNKPSPINFFDASIHMGPIVVMRGTQSAVDYYKVLLKELCERKAQGQGAVPQEEHRIYWEGMPLWFNLSSMAKLFASLNTCIVASTYCNSWVFDLLDPQKPFESQARAYTELFITRSSEIKEKVLIKLFKDFSVDGIIYHDAKTCPRNSNSRFGLQTRLYKETKIPYLEIYGDLNDSRCFGKEQTETAISTFIEQLKMRK